MKCDICGKPATMWSGCYNQDCTTTHYYHFCDKHFDPEIFCLRCGTVLDSNKLADEDELPTVPTLDSGKINLLKDDEEDEPKLLNVDELVGSCGTGKFVNSDEMAVTVKVCNGFEMTDAVLTHSFHEMRAAELAIRKQCGISVSGITAKGINIALMELRLLLVDKECNVYEIAVQLCDGFGRNLLLCSTGGVVLTEETEITRLEALQTKTAASPEEILVLNELKTRKLNGNKLVRCCASSMPYGGSKLFAMCGAYSFFNSGGLTGEDLNIAASSYQQKHDGGYRKWVNGSDNDQLFHHSEQTGFKMLCENPNLLVKVLRKAFNDGFLPDLTVSLKAVSIDIFTTRSACGGCMKCAVCVLSSGHIFDLLLSKVQEAEFVETVICKDVRKIVRFDCAALFDGLHKFDPPKDCLIIHGNPRSKQGRVPKPHGGLATFRISIHCNANDNILLDSGSQKQFMPAILKKIKEEMQIIDLPDSPQKMADLFLIFMKRYGSDLHSGVVTAAYLINKLTSSSSSGGIFGELGRTASKVVGSNLDGDTLKLALKFYYFFKFFSFKDDLATNVFFCGLIGCGTYYFGAPEFGRTFLRAFAIAYAHNFEKPPPKEFLEAVFNKTREMIVTVIEKLLAMDNPMAENAARLLALYYDVLDDYKRLLG